MSAVADASNALAAALLAVEGLRVYTDPGASVDPPAALIGPPQLIWDTFDSAPTQARFVVFVAAAGDGQAMERLWNLVPQVKEAAETLQNAVVQSPAHPGVLTAGRTDLPCYELQIEVAL